MAVPSLTGGSYASWRVPRLKPAAIRRSAASFKRRMNTALPSTARWAGVTAGGRREKPGRGARKRTQHPGWSSAGVQAYALCPTSLASLVPPTRQQPVQHRRGALGPGRGVQQASQQRQRRALAGVELIGVLQRR